MATPPQHQLYAARPLRELCADDLCRGRLIKVTAGGLAECSHDLAHLLLGRGAQLGDDLLDQSLELLARNLCGQQALQNLDLLGQVVCILSGIFSVGETKSLETLSAKIHGYGSDRKSVV